MTIRAIDLLNDFLKIYNKDGTLYKQLIGDTTRVEARTLLMIKNITAAHITTLRTTGAYTWLYTFYPYTVGPPPGGDFGSIQDPANTFVAGTTYLIDYALKIQITSTDPIVIYEGDTLRITTNIGKLTIYLPYISIPSGSFDLYVTLDGSTFYDAALTLPAWKAPVKVNSINTGAISNIVEYNRRLKDYLIEQMDVNTANRFWLKYLGNNIYGVPSRTGEIDDLFRIRMIEVLTGFKTTRVSIITAATPYSLGGTPQILEGPSDGAFADVSYANYYLDGSYGGVIIKPAICGQDGGIPFWFRLVVFSADPSNYPAIASLVTQLRAAGIQYILEAF